MTVCALGGEEIEGVALHSPIYGGPACATHALRAFSVLALTPKTSMDKDGHDRRRDAEAEARLGDIDPYGPLPEDLIDLQDVAGGALAGSSSAPTPGGRAASSPPCSPAGESTDDSGPAGSSRRAA